MELVIGAPLSRVFCQYFSTFYSLRMPTNSSESILSKIGISCETQVVPIKASICFFLLAEDQVRKAYTSHTKLVDFEELNFVLLGGRSSRVV